MHTRPFSGRRCLMSRRAGQLISRGTKTWLVRVPLGREPETGTRKYHNKTIHGSFREAQNYLVTKLKECGVGQLPHAADIKLNKFSDQWLTTAAKPRLRPKTYTDYQALLRRHIRPTLGIRALGAITHNAEIAIMQSHSADVALWPAF
jgi:integrase